jgi:purine catabolism regulator
VIIAAGGLADSPLDARRSLAEASQVAEAALLTEHRPGYHRLQDVRLRGLLHLLRDDPRVRTFVERELKPLLGEPDLLDVE